MVRTVWRKDRKNIGGTIVGDLTPVKIKGTIGIIEDNLNEVELSIYEKVKEYRAVVVTEDTIKDGKKFLADIRKERNYLEDERKAIKKQWMIPYEKFEKRAKEIIALYDEPVKIINDQLLEYEKHRKEMKRKEIQSIYDFVKGELEEWLPLNHIFNEKWENTSYSSKKIREEMELIFDQMKVSISTIRSMNSEFEEDALYVLKETGSLQSAISEITELQKQKERFMKQAKREIEQEQEEVQPLKQLENEFLEAHKTLEGQAIVEEEKEILMNDAPFAMEKILTVVIKIGENDFGILKEFLEISNLEYEVM